MANARMLLVALVWLAPTQALAGSYDPNLHVKPGLKDCSVIFSSDLTQSAYGRFVREFGSVSAFKPMSSAATLGPWGVSVGVEMLNFAVEEKSNAWNDTFAHPNASHPLGSDQTFPKLRVRVGVTDRMDLGAFYARNPEANYGWLGLEAKYGLKKQSETVPFSLAVRGAYTKTLYVHDMDMHTLTADVAASRTLGNLLTPYLYLGSDAVYARETSDAVDLNDETQFAPHAIGGLELRYWHMAIGAEAHVSTLTSFEVSVATVF
jgi:hypothetical protein